MRIYKQIEATICSYKDTELQSLDQFLTICTECLDETECEQLKIKLE